MSQELPRWGDDAPDQLRAAKAAYGQLAPDDAALERILSAVEANAAASHAGGASRSGLRLLAGVVGAVLVGALIWGWMVRAGAPAGRVPALAAPQQPALPPQVSSTTPVTHLQAREPSEAPSSSATKRRTRPRNHAARTATDPLGELSLLTRARRVLRADPARSLALTEEHVRNYPRGALQEERELLALEALFALGRSSHVARRAAAFRRDFPNSVHLARVRELVEK